jgi:hypothetical protein
LVVTVTVTSSVSLAPWLSVTVNRNVSVALELGAVNVGLEIEELLRVTVGVPI